jgi:hypothetical protein
MVTEESKRKKDERKNGEAEMRSEESKVVWYRIVVPEYGRRAEREAVLSDLQVPA